LTKEIININNTAEALVKLQKQNIQFGEKIREIREKRGVTLKEVAISAGVSESLVSQIERNKVSPALDTLMAIVDVLDIDLEYLFADYKRERNVTLIHKDERRKIVTKKATYERLSQTVQDDKDHGIEAYILEIPAGGEKGNEEYGHVGKEMGVIISGCGEFRIGTKTYQLSEGDSISFSSDIPHLLINTENEPLRAFWVITPPKAI
jgi:transcriptional regulator with XRE-family HTH domain